MADIKSTKSLEQFINDNDRSRDCFYDHKGVPFRFKDHIATIKRTALTVQRDGLVNQQGLTAISLPFPEIDVELEESQRPLSLLSPMYENETLDPHKLLHFALNDALYLPKEDLDLGYDFGKDFARYQQDVQQKRHCNLSNEWLPFCFVDIEKDEGLSLASTSSRWQILALRELEREGIKGFDDDSGLSGALDQGLTTLSQYSQQLTKEDLGIGKCSNLCTEPVSVPLSPVSEGESVVDAFIPNNEATIIDLTSEPSSPPNPGGDEMQRDYKNGCLESEPPAPSPSLPSSPPPADVFKLTRKEPNSAASLKIDVPLVFSTSPNSENDKFSVGLKDISMDKAEINGFPIDGCNSFFDEAMMEVTQDGYCRALQMTEDEKLDPTGSLLRLRVPSLSFKVDPAEWSLHLSTPEAHLTWLRTKFRDSFKLAGMDSLVGLGETLKWYPIPLGSGRVPLDETLDKLGEGSQNYLILEQPQLCSMSFISQRSSPSIFQIVDDTEIEDEPTFDIADRFSSTDPLTIAPDMQASKQGRQLESLLISGLSCTTLPKADELNLPSYASLLPETTNSNATSDLLSSFIDLRRPKKAKLAKGVSGSLKAIRAQQSDLSTARPSPMQDHNEPFKHLEKAAAPEVLIPKERCRFIVSLGLNRAVLAHIEKLWPRVELIDRDFAQYNTVTWSSASTQRREVISPLSYEADIVLSPSAGLILTTLLKFRQRPLPGSTQLTALRNRIKQVSPKYETLFVLVSEANPAGEFVGSPSASDLAAYAEFEKFMTQLQVGITTEFISGKEETLAKWTVSLMHRFAHENNTFGHLLHTEDSPWDVSFRRAGMNILAAQVLSGVLRSEYGSLGFEQFLAMNLEERVTRYRPMMGGDRVFRSVCKSLDQELKGARGM